MKKLWDSWFGTLVLALILMFCGIAILGIPTELLKETSLGSNSIYMSVEGYISFLGIWVLTLIYYAKSRRDHWLLPLLGRGTKGNTLPMLLLGLVLGFAMNGGCIWVAVQHGDFALQSAGNCSIPVILLIFVCIFIQSSAEELICRNFLYQKLTEQSGKPIIAIVANALFFTALHLGNSGITPVSVLNLFLCGIMMSLFVWATDSLWIVFGIHTMWNFTQNIIFGLPNSGQTVPYSIMTIAGTPKDSFAYSASFGIEGGLLACGIYVLVSIVVYCIGHRQGRKLC